MRLLFLTLFLYGFTSAASQPESTETSSTNKISSTKSTTNAIQTTPQKTTGQQSQAHYIPQYVVQKPQAPAQTSQQPAAMYILAQPASLAVHGAPFQQAVHQLLNYYNTNPQAKYQLLQQQHGGFPQGGYQPASFAQNSFPANFQQIPQHIPLPSGALHVIPSPQLNGIGHLAPTPLPANVQYAFAVPAQSQFNLGPSFLAHFQQAPQFPTHSAQISAQLPIHSLGGQSIGAQALLGHALSGHSLGHQAILAHSLPTVATQLVPAQSSGSHSSSGQSSSAHGTPISTTLSTSSAPSSSSSGAGHALPQAQALTQSFPIQSSSNHPQQQHISNHITTQQITSQLPTHYSSSAQLAQYQPHSQFGSGLAIGSIAPHGQFGLKSHVAGPIFATNDYLTQTEKNVQGSSNNYNPVYRTTYIKG